MPENEDVVSKRAQRRAVGRHGVVSEIAGDDLREPFPGFRNWPVHSMPQPLLDLAPSPAFGPEVEDVMKIYVREQRRNHRTLPRPFFLNRHDPVFKDAGSQPFLDEPDDALVADPMLQEADNPLLGNFREERSDVGVQYVVHFLAADSDDHCIQRIVLAAVWSEPIREPEEILLVD